MESFNIMGLPDEKLETIIDAYLNGRKSFTISGDKYIIDNLHSFKIFTHEVEKDPNEIYENAIELGIAKRNIMGYHIPPEGLSMLGKNVTDEFLGDAEFGKTKKVNVNISSTNCFINPKRIEELKQLSNEKFDFKRLIQLCIEINDNYSRNNYLSVAMLGRSIINHIPPLFGFETFNEVANNYGSKSFKGIMNHLNITMRGMADSFLHDTIRKKENIPNETQVNFSQDIDVLLSEIIRIN